MNGHSVVFGRLVSKFRIFLGFTKSASVGQGLKADFCKNVFNVQHK